MRISRAVDPGGGAPRGTERSGMGLTRYTLDSMRSCIWVSGRSSLHPINTETRGITGWFEATTRDDGSLDLDLPVSGELELAVDRLDVRQPALRPRAAPPHGCPALPDHRRPRHQASPPVVRIHATRSRGTSCSTARPGRSSTRCTSTFTRRRSRSRETYVFDIREFGMKPPSMLMVRVYPGDQRAGRAAGNPRRVAVAPSRGTPAPVAPHHVVILPSVQSAGGLASISPAH